MNRKILTPALLSLCGCLSLSAFSNVQAAPVGSKPSFPTLTYWDNWTDSHGVSHLSRCQLTAFHALNGNAIPATPKETAKIIAQDHTRKTKEPEAPIHQPMIWTGMNHAGGVTVTTVVQPPGWHGAWTATKHMKWVVPLAGTYVVEAMDGNRVELNPGDLLLSEDMTSKRDAQGKLGHKTGNDGKDAVALLITQINTAVPASTKECGLQENN